MRTVFINVALLLIFAGAVARARSSHGIPDSTARPCFASRKQG